jgi:hypothetical protein
VTNHWRSDEDLVERQVDGITTASELIAALMKLPPEMPIVVNMGGSLDEWEEEARLLPPYDEPGTRWQLS